MVSMAVGCCRAVTLQCKQARVCFSVCECIAMSARLVLLEGGSPWGFRMTGGIDTGSALRISRVTCILYSLLVYHSTLCTSSKPNMYRAHFDPIA